MLHGFHEIEDDLLGCKAVDAVWTFHSSKTCWRHIVPDGRADLLLSFDVGSTGSIRNVVPIIAPPFMVAHSVFTRAHQGYVGIRFKPGFGGAFLTRSLRSMVGRLFEGQSALNCAPGLRDLQGQYRSIQYLLDFLNLSLARQRNGIISSDVAETLTFIDENAGEARLGELAEALGTPIRTLNRRFTNNVGLSPKQYAQVVRLRQAVQMLAKDETSSAHVAVDCGFSDQAHMSREVKRFMRHTPRQLYRLAQEGNLLS